MALVPFEMTTVPTTGTILMDIATLAQCLKNALPVWHPP